MSSNTGSISPSSRLPEKIKLIDNRLREVTLRKNAYRKKMLKYKALDHISEFIIILASVLTIGTSSIRLFIEQNLVIILCTIFSVISGFTIAIKRFTDVRGQCESYKNTYIQYSNLERDIQSNSVQTFKSSSQGSEIINIINLKMSYIESTAIPIEIS